MDKNIQEILVSLEQTNIANNFYNVALALRAKLGDEQVKTLFKEKKYDDEDYNYYLTALRLIEIDNSEESEDGLKYPLIGRIDSCLWKPVAMVDEALNSLNGVTVNSGVIYLNGTCYRSKGYWDITFDTIEDFNHFLWAGCYRYFPLSDLDKWRIFPDIQDTNYNEKKIKVELHYMKINAKKEDMERDFTDLARGIDLYSNDEDILKNKFEK